MIRTVLIIETAARTLSEGAPLIRFRENRKTMLEQPDHHAHIASFLGIRYVVAELNKMDHLDYCEVFLHLQRDFLSSPSDVSVKQTNHLSRSWQQLNDGMTLYLVASVCTGLRRESPTAPVHLQPGAGAFVKSSIAFVGEDATPSFVTRNLLPVSTVLCQLAWHLAPCCVTFYPVLASTIAPGHVGPGANSYGKSDLGGGRAAMHGYTDAVLWSQGDGGERLDGMTVYEVEMELLLDHGEQQRSLQHGEGGADAYPRTTTEREIGESRDSSRADGIFAPALRIKCVWVGEEPRVALRQRLKDEDIRAGSHAIAANFAVRHGPTSNTPNGRIEPHGLFEDHFGVAQKRKILDCRLTIAEHRAKLFDKLGLDARILCE